jgi:hypothetical protein
MVQDDIVTGGVAGGSIGGVFFEEGPIVEFGGGGEEVGKGAAEVAFGGGGLGGEVGEGGVVVGEGFVGGFDQGGVGHGGLREGTDDKGGGT